MTPENEDTHSEILDLLKENSSLIHENNALIKKMYRYDMITFWVRIVWYGILIGLPFIMYFYILQPYFEMFGANYELFRQGMAEIPGLKGLENFLPRIGG